MLIEALCAITAPDVKGVSLTFNPGDVGDVRADKADYLIDEGFAVEAPSGAKATAAKTSDIPKLPKPGVKKADRPGKATAIKARGEPEKETATTKRKRARANLLGDDKVDADRNRGENGKKFEDE